MSQETSPKQTKNYHVNHNTQMKGCFSSAIGNWSTLGIGKVWPLGSSLNGRKVFYRRTLFNFTTSRIQNMGSVTGWLDSCHMLQYAVIMDHLESSQFSSGQNFLGQCLLFQSTSWEGKFSISFMLDSV